MAKAPIDVRLYRSSVKGRRPNPADMSYGDLAINYNHEDPALIIKGDDNALIEFKPAVGVTVGAVAPATAKDGELWWDTVSARLLVRYTSGTPAVSAWVDASPAAVGGGGSAGGGGVTIGATAPATAKDGDLWWDSVGGRLYVFYTSGTPASGSWVDASPISKPPKPLVLGWACGDETTAMKIATAVVSDHLPVAMTLSTVKFNVVTAPTGAAIVLDVKLNGISIFTTKPQIAAAAKTSSAGVLSTTTLPADGLLTVDVTQVGATAAGAGLKMYLIGVEA